jgi:hypothetical protein
VDVLGHFKGKGTGGAGDVKFTGLFQVLRDQGALVLATYKFTFPDGAVDQGTTRLLRSFTPPDPVTPPDITGDWSGTTRSDLTGQPMDITLQITSQRGTSFEGVEIVAGWHKDDIVGTIGVSGNFVYIGVSDVEQVLVGGQFQPPPDDGLNATYVRNLPTGVVDLGTFMVTPAPR